jgi:hypothetical protein
VAGELPDRDKLGEMMTVNYPAFSLPSRLCGLEYAAPQMPLKRHAAAAPPMAVSRSTRASPETPAAALPTTPSRCSPESPLPALPCSARCRLQGPHAGCSFAHRIPSTPWRLIVALMAHRLLGGNVRQQAVGRDAPWPSLAGGSGMAFSISSSAATGAPLSRCMAVSIRWFGTPSSGASG